MAAVSADGRTVCVLILRLNSSCSRSMALVVRALFHWLGGKRAKVKRPPPAWLSSQHQENRFFKSILRREVPLGMERARHQLTPAMPMQKVVHRAVAGWVPDRLLVSRLEIVDVQ